MQMTIKSASEAIRDGRLSAVALLETCLDNIDRQEQNIRAWVLVDREGARTAARTADEEIRRGRYRGPLHGIPMGIKDIIDVFDLPTAAGSRLWSQSIACHDATCVRKLREAGAIIVGKTVTTQYASYDPSVTRNPWNAERTPGGSSSGSAAAVATSMCLGALASQTGGSLNRPASYCGVAGLKATYGRVSKAGVVPLAWSMDHIGPMARCTFDLAAILQAIAGPDPADSASTGPAAPDYLTALNAPQKPPRIGVLAGMFRDSADDIMRQAIDQSVRAFRSQGAMVRDVALPAGFAEVPTRHHAVMAVEAAQYHRPRLEKHPEDYLPCISKLLGEGLACSADDYARCKEHQKAISRDMEKCFDGVDVLLAPATTGPAPPAVTTGSALFNVPWSYTGLPSLSLPAGQAPDGMPIAIQLIGGRWCEAEVLCAGEWCEDTLGRVCG
jgi:aspartyl-tRNA(Asn)/glutamyl-tRNA(Gln) amidotransferase subunit A